jgi:hypothetical protein
MTDKPTKRRASLWDIHSTPAKAAEAAKTHAAEEIAMLRAEVVRLTNERDQARAVAREMAEPFGWRDGIDRCRHCGRSSSRGVIAHLPDCPVRTVRAWDTLKEAE